MTLNAGMKEIYLDNASTTRPFDEVVDYMDDIYRNRYANPSSTHKKGAEAEKAIVKARETIAAAISADQDQIVFTSGGTESNNLAIQGYLAANQRAGRHILSSPIEHPSVLEVFRKLQDAGYETEQIAVNKDGRIDLDSLARKLRKSTALVSIMLVNNETGAIQPVETAAQLIREKGSAAVLHVDAVQGYGKIPFHPAEWGIGLASLSGHKIHGPKGSGALFIGKGIKIKPLVFGGGQEGMRRSGTENVAGIGGFGMASGIVVNNMEQNYQKTAMLKEKLIRRLNSEIGGITVNSPAEASPYIANISFERIKGLILLNHLEQNGVYVSTVAACSSKKKQRSYVLEAADLSPELVEGALRFSFGLLNTEEDINDTIKILKSIVPNLRKYYK